MPRFFVEYTPGATAVLEGEDARHVAKSLRMQPGENLTICDGKGWDYHCRIEHVSSDIVHLRVAEKVASRGVPCSRIRLYQALPKGDKLDLIVQKATELGVQEIVPVVTARCVSRPDSRGMERKAKRLQKIALEAAKQSGRGRIPTISPMVSLADALEGMRRSDLAILFYEGSDVPLREVLDRREGTPGDIAILIGSEGGFSEREAEEAQEAGVLPASLGSRILRCETAPICAISAILYHLGEF